MSRCCAGSGNMGPGEAVLARLKILVRGFPVEGLRAVGLGDREVAVGGPPICYSSRTSRNAGVCSTATLRRSPSSTSASKTTSSRRAKLESMGKFASARRWIVAAIRAGIGVPDH